MDRSVG